MVSDIISKIKEADLYGGSGSMFPVAKKWEIVKEADSPKKYLICNASEGELETFKDYHILKNFPQKVIEGITLAVDTLSIEKAYIYLKYDYFDELAKVFDEFSQGSIEVIKKRGGYVGGEETSVISSIEGGRPEPRPKPPYPAKTGLWGYPTLVNNVESFYRVAEIGRGEYLNMRFYSVSGDAPNKGVFEFPKDITVKKLLEKTANNPSFDYFLQVGGGAGGSILLPKETDVKFDCLGSVVIYEKEKTDTKELMRKWVNFFLEGNCDQCTPCREGLFRIMKMIESEDFNEIEDIFLVMKETSLCALGERAVNPFKTLLEKVIEKR